MKQPREDVQGALRTDDDLLSLDERAMPVRKAIVVLARHLSTACMVGNPAPVVERMGARLRSPQVGDLVVESTTAMRQRNDDWYRGFGYLVEHRREWWHTDEDWAHATAEDPGAWGDERPTDEAWYVQYGPQPEDVCRWTNADFLVIPIDVGTFNQPLSTSDGRGVTVTRVDLLGSLADSGFSLRLPD